MESQYVFLNSMDRIYCDSCNFMIDIKDIHNDLNLGLQIQKLSIPFSYHPIRSLNNVINYDFLQGGVTGANRNITFMTQLIILIIFKYMNLL